MIVSPAIRTSISTCICVWTYHQYLGMELDVQASQLSLYEVRLRHAPLPRSILCSKREIQRCACLLFGFTNPISKERAGLATVTTGHRQSPVVDEPLLLISSPSLLHTFSTTLTPA